MSELMVKLNSRRNMRLIMYVSSAFATSQIPTKYQKLNYGSIGKGFAIIKPMIMVQTIPTT